MSGYSTVSTDGVAPYARIHAARVEATTEADIKRNMKEDELAVLSDAGEYTRRIQRRRQLRK